MAPPYDQLFRIGGAYNYAGKSPYFYFADQELIAGGYVNNSLEGTLFSSNPALAGTILLSNSYVTPRWAFYSQNVAVTSAACTVVSIVSGICTVTYDTALIPTLAVNDVVSVNGVDWDTTHPFVNGSWVVTSITLAGGASTFTFEIDASDTASYSGLLASAVVSLGPAFSIYDNRSSAEAKGQSFTSVLFTPKKIYDAGSSTGTKYKRVLPSDLYTRFRIQSASDISPQGGINSNLFNVLSADGLNIKPALWAYFFGYNNLVSPANLFHIVFNSYAFVLRPSGEGSKLEFALMKFSWSPTYHIDSPADWTAVISAAEDKYKSHTVSGTDLGYLICTNPEVTNSVAAVITELAKSDSFTYNSAVTPKFNLKITVRKHMLSDSVLDGTYLANLMVNDSYDDFGEAAHYDTILHAYIAKPSQTSNTTNNVALHDCMLMPIMYFKYNNTNEDNVQTNASKIVQDSLFFRQINSASAATYLY